MQLNGSANTHSSRTELIHKCREVASAEAFEVFTDAVKLEQDAAAFLNSKKAAGGAVSVSNYTCSTEKPVAAAKSHNPAAIWVGLFDHIPRWKRNSVINFATFTGGYPLPGQAAYAASQLRKAADEWNAITRDYVTFQWTSRLEDAAFVLSYGGNQGSVLASAFFPDEKPINMLYVYEFALEEEWLPIMKNVFLHELGHVLGLRHEFAAQEGGAIKFGRSNEDSVMAYKFPPTIQESDKTDLKAFYEYDGKRLGMYPILDMIPDN